MKQQQFGMVPAGRDRVSRRSDDRVIGKARSPEMTESGWIQAKIRKANTLVSASRFIGPLFSFWTLFRAATRSRGRFRRCRRSSFRRFAFHDGGKLAAVDRRLILEVIGGRRDDLLCEAALHQLAAHLVFAGPGPGVAFHRAFGGNSLARAVEFVIGVDLLFLVIAQI